MKKSNSSVSLPSTRSPILLRTNTQQDLEYSRITSPKSMLSRVTPSLLLSTNSLISPEKNLRPYTLDFQSQKTERETQNIY
jgi:hypothetical protein